MQLSIAYLNDVHGYLERHPELFYEGAKEVTRLAGGYAAIASKLKEIRSRNKNTLLFDSGDTFHGTLVAIQTKGEVLVPILNALGFNAMVSHWDFAYGPAQLKKLAGQLNYPILGINVYNKDGSILFLPPYIMINVEDIKIAVQFVTNADIAFSNGWRYGSPISTGDITVWELFNIIPMNPRYRL